VQKSANKAPRKINIQLSTIVFEFYVTGASIISLWYSISVVSSSAVHCLQRHVSDMICCVLPGTQNCTAELTQLGTAQPCNVAAFVYGCVQVNRGQTGGMVGYDINVVPVWRKGITGRGIVVSILDDGIDHTHPDLRRNYVCLFQAHFISRVATA